MITGVNNNQSKMQIDSKLKSSNEIIKEVGNQILKKVEDDKKNQEALDEQASKVELSENSIEQMKAQLESMKKEKDGWINIAKMMEIARRISRGDRVPVLDEKKLMEFDKEMYQMAKMSGLMAKNKNPEKHKSLFEEEKDKELRELLKKYENGLSKELYGSTQEQVPIDCESVTE